MVTINCQIFVYLYFNATSHTIDKYPKKSAIIRESPHFFIRSFNLQIWRELNLTVELFDHQHQGSSATLCGKCKQLVNS